MFVWETMKMRIAKWVLICAFVVFALIGPELVYRVWDSSSEHSPIADQLRKLSAYHEHDHAELLKTEHRRHFEAFDFITPYDKLKPTVQAMFTGSQWEGKDEVDFIEYWNVGEGRVAFIRFAKNQDVGLYGDRTSNPPGDKGLKPWAVVMYKNTWFDDYMFQQWGNPFFPLFSPYSCGYCCFVILLLLPFVKRRNPSIPAPPIRG